MRKLKNEIGRTMVEMLGVLSIMGLIMYGAVAGIGFGLDMYKISATHSEVEELARGIIDLYSWSRSYSNLGPDIICQNDVAGDCTCDDQARMTGCVVRSKFNGAIIIHSDGADEQGFVIQYNNLPNLACNRLKVMTYANFPRGARNSDNSAGADCHGDNNSLFFFYGNYENYEN